MRQLIILLLAALPAWAGFTHTTQTIPLAFGQKEATVVFEASEAIKRAKPLCECTTLRVEGKKLIATVDTAGFSKDIDKQIDATTADGVATKLTMRFSVPQALTLSARSLIWKQGQPATAQTLRITIPKGSPVHQVTEASLSGDGFVYTPQIVKPGAEYCVRITPKSTAKKILNRLIIKTDSTDPRYEGSIIYLSIHP